MNFVAFCLKLRGNKKEKGVGNPTPDKGNVYLYYFFGLSSINAYFCLIYIHFSAHACRFNNY